ncbi:DddA-like double-stranded DNA deaminase toxin [Streptomyces sp. NPDC056269]|uniref:DddA-like double-stranded DNA deaminase toxin n=1 Tax=Streptomyces sp. NPDC056269 TaxID=3345768 RepID=UPI0035D6EF06
MAVVNYWEEGGAGVKKAAEKALLGSDQDVDHFFDIVDGIEFADNSVTASRMFAVAGPGVRAAAHEALDGTPEQLATFLRSGWQGPLDADRQVEISSIVTSADAGVRAAGIAALEGTREDRANYLAKGRYGAQRADDQVEASKIYTKGGPNVRAAAKLALGGTQEDVSEFLTVGQHVARNRDAEHASISELAKQAKKAGQKAATATKGAQDASERAIDASREAKKQAETAAAETAEAKNDAKVATEKAQQAADAARAAGTAALQAVGAANAANEAARTATVAAAQTAAAATAAANAANTAYNAAIAAGQDAAKSAEAKTAAATALMAATLAEGSAAAAEMAGKASAAAANAVRAAASAGDNANLAAGAADQAANSAAAAGGHSADARAAANEARRQATVANTAANNAAALADRSAAAAFAARTAANSAAAHARKSAAAASLAVEHAGEAASQAAVANNHAAAAKQAWETADAATRTARETFQLARDTEATDLATRTAAAVEWASSREGLLYDGVSNLAKQEQERRSLDTTAAGLAAEADDPNINVSALATKGRQLAFQALRISTPLSQDAAARALAGTDQHVIQYLRSGWREAEKREVRERVVQLAHLSPYPSVQQGAAAALKGNLDQIESFYTTGQYSVGLADMSVAASAIHSKGGPSVKEVARAALADGSGKALARFLQATQYSARFADESVIASQIYGSTSTGAEVKSAARIALAGTADQLHQFITVGRYTADRKDKLARQHEAQVQRRIAEASLIAATANKNRWLAAEAAAHANDASGEATDAASRAQESARQAEKHAKEADAAADAAEASATEAKQAAATAHSAAIRADQDADTAERAAARAEASASYAQYSAARAGDAADSARASAEQAGQNAEDANEMASNAWEEVKYELEKEIAEEIKKAEEEQKKREQQQDQEREGERCLSGAARYPTWVDCSETELLRSPNRIDIQSMWSVFWTYSGGEDIQKCIENPAIADCALALVGILPVGKLKLMGKAADDIEGLINKLRKKGDGKKELPNCPTLPRASNYNLAGYTVQAANAASGNVPPLFCDRDAELAAMPPYDGQTLGRAKSSDGRSWDENDLASGRQKQDAELIDWVNKKMLKEGVTTGYKTGNRFHTEPKFVAIMKLKVVKDADLVINNPEGPCPVIQGCDATLSALLKDVGVLRVHWKDIDGVWHSEQYPKGA